MSLGSGPPVPERQRLGGALALSVGLHLLALISWQQGPLPAAVATRGPAPPAVLTARFLHPADEGQAEAGDAFQVRRDTPAAEPLPAADAGGDGRQRSRIVREIYEDLDELDVRPWIRTRIRPEYPPPLPPGIESVTVLSFVVDEEGAVSDLTVVEPGADPLFDLFALEAFAQARYTPALIAGRPVKVRMRVRVGFNSP